MNLDRHLTEIALLKLNSQSLLVACQTNKLTQEICQDDQFWAKKVREDFPTSIQFMSLGRSYWDWYWTLVEHPNNEESLDWAIQNEYLDLLRWLIDQKVELSQEMIDQITNLNMLIYLAELGYLPTLIGANLAAERGDIQILNWLELRNILPDEGGAIFAYLQNQHDVIDWLSMRGIHVPDLGGI